MKRFEFKLEKLLSLRQFEQDQAEIELGKAVAEEHRIQTRLDNLSEQYENAKQTMRGETDFIKISDAQRLYSFIKAQRERLGEEMEAAKAVTEEKRNLFNLARQKTESLNSLKEREAEAHRQAEKKEEVKALDDVVTYKYNPNSAI